jgi:Fe2+ transport system protein FeoA
MIIIIKGGWKMTLDKACSGQRFQVLSIDDRNISNQVIRLGICKGAELTCAGKLPGGPIIIQNKMQEIAIGRRLAKKIAIQVI